MKDIQTDEQYKADIKNRQKGARASKDILQTQTETGSANIAARNGWMDGRIDRHTDRETDRLSDRHVLNITTTNTCARVSEGIET